MSGLGIGVSKGSVESDKVASVDKTAFGELTVAENTGVFFAHFPYNINPRITSSLTDGAGTVVQNNDLAEVHSGASASSIAVIATKESLEYQPGTGGLFRGTAIFDTPAEGNDQFIGIGDNLDGFFFGYEGTDFGVLRRRDGVNDFIPQSSWNIDKYDGTGKSGVTLDKTKGNIYQIKYQWLGFGAIRFYIENPDTGSFDAVHVIKYANKNAEASVTNPTFVGAAISSNTTNDTDVVLKVGCLSGYLEGNASSAGHVRNSFDNLKTVATAETNVFTLRTRASYEGAVNRVRIQPDFFNVASDGTKTFNVNVYLNATLGGTPSFTDIDTNTSVAEVDTAGTTVTGGIKLFSFVVQKIGGFALPLKEYEIILPPGDSITFAAATTVSGEIDIACSWQERFT